MAFWGIEVKASKPYTHRFDDEKGKLHLSQATLGTGSSSKKTILQCNVGDKRPVYLCSLLPEKFENCPLNLEFEGEDEVIFSVIGPYSIHLSGFFIGETQDYGRDDYESDSYGEDIAETESDESTDYDTEDEYDNDFIVEDLDMYPPSPVPNSGVVIEEILDDEKPADANGTAKRGKKKIRLSTSDDNANSERQLILKSGNGASILESEDEDGLPISLPRKNKADASSIKGKAEEKKYTRPDDESKKAAEDDHARVDNLKRKVDSILQGGEQKRKAGKQLDSSLASTEVVPEADKKKNKKKKKGKEEKTTDAGTGSKSNMQSEAVMTDMEQDRPVGKEQDEKDLDIGADSIAEEKKRKKKKKKTKKQRSNADTEESVPDKIVSTKDKDTQKETESKPFHVRSFPNGLVIEELAMGKPDGNKASPGKKVSVRYIGKLKKNGEIFDSNIGKAPFKFRLGVGQVIKGWDVGVNGMRVGDKRRLTIPPAMGYGATGAGRAIPPNAWLLFDVELVEVR